MWQRLTLNQPIVEEQVDFIKKGETPLSDVAKELGAPDEILNLKNRLVARYHFIDTRYLRVDFGWGLRFVIPYYSPDLVLGGGGAATGELRAQPGDRVDWRLGLVRGRDGLLERLVGLMVVAQQQALARRWLKCSHFA